MIARVLAILFAARLVSQGITAQELYAFFHPSGLVYPNELTMASDGALYATTANGGNGYGTVFRLTTNGIMTPLATFADTNGSAPQAALVQGRDGALYGTTYFGGNAGDGTVFRVTTTGVL